MAKWKCEICGNEFENFHAQGFDNKIYCPLCYFKKENKELKNQLEEWKKLLNKFKNQQKEFIEFLEDKEKQFDAIGEPKNAGACKGILRKYQEIMGVSDDSKAKV